MNVTDKGLKYMLIHAIDADDAMQRLEVTSKLNADWGFLMYLHQIGHDRADKWLELYFDTLGVASTVNIRTKYL